MVAYSGELLGKLSCTPFRLIRELGFAMVNKEKAPAGETGQKGGAAAINDLSSSAEVSGAPIMEGPLPKSARLMTYIDALRNLARSDLPDRVKLIEKNIDLYLEEGARCSLRWSSKLHLSSAIAAIGIDIGKNSFHVVGLDARGAILLRQKWSRGQVEGRLANVPPCLIGMEACVGAHHLSRKLKAFGHDARLMPAKYVRPYSKRQKNDFRDAEAIAEAVQRPTMKFVATKTAEQLDLAGAPPGARAISQSAHRHHQSNPRLPIRARGCRTAGSTVLAR